MRSKRRGSPSDIIAAKVNYDLAKKILRRSIRSVKSASWGELIATIDRDPWGLPYRIVMGKLRTSELALTEVLEDCVLNKLIDSLFPVGQADASNHIILLPFGWDEELDVSINEISRVTRKRPSRNATPGPDNLRAVV